MPREQLRLFQPRVRPGCALAAALLIAPVSPAVAQDIRGLEICTAEKQIDRRTACLQANAEFLQQALSKLERETDEKIVAADRKLAAARAEIAALRSTIEKLGNELAQIRAKAESQSKK
jgi:septal ring factor EnvC (AmiA/AmiB activator)